MKTKRSAPALDWLCDLTGRTARITSVGNRTLLVENHRGVVEFGGERIVLATGCGSVTVEGADLALSQLRRDALIIEGEIENVHLPCGEVRRHEP